MTRNRFIVTMTLLGGALVLCAGAAVMTLQARNRAQAPIGVTVVDARLTSPAVAAPDDGTGLPVLFDAPAFDLINQDAQPLKSSDLAGRPYIAAFMFTNCTTACPMMAGRLFTLQDDIKSPRIRFVSFTVDPDRDTPEVLKKYLTNFKAKPDRWTFATGTKPQMQAVEKGFNLRLPPPPANAPQEPVPGADPNDPMNLQPHSDRFVLIDAQGKVRGLYDSKDDNAMAKLKADAELLASK